MGLFVTVTDELICKQLAAARRQIIYAAPGISKPVASALEAVFKRADKVNVTVVLDGSEEACRVGYGDPDGLAELMRVASEQHFPVQRQPGLRAALLVVDEAVLVWSPTPRSVEETGELGDAPNGVVLDGTASSVADAVAAPGSGCTLDQAEIGREPLTIEHVKHVLEATKRNPIIDFDLTRKTAVFSSKFQFVETELRGAEWVEREIQLSSLLMNMDLPEETRVLLDTRVRPFANLKDLKLPAPVLIEGQIAYNKHGEPIQWQATQADMHRAWGELKDRYLISLSSFGWLIRKSDVQEFEESTTEFESVLKLWVAAFGKEIATRREDLLSQLTAAAIQRMARSSSKGRVPSADDLRRQLNASLSKMAGKSEVRIKRFYKAVAPASTKHGEFLDALKAALPEDEYRQWYDTWLAANAR